MEDHLLGSQYHGKPTLQWLVQPSRLGGVFYQKGKVKLYIQISKTRAMYYFSTYKTETKKSYILKSVRFILRYGNFFQRKDTRMYTFFYCDEQSSFLVLTRRITILFFYTCFRVQFLRGQHTIENKHFYIFSDGLLIIFCLQGHP